MVLWVDSYVSLQTFLKFSIHREMSENKIVFSQARSTFRKSQSVITNFISVGMLPDPHFSLALLTRPSHFRRLTRLCAHRSTSPTQAIERPFSYVYVWIRNVIYSCSTLNNFLFSPHGRTCCYADGYGNRVAGQFTNFATSYVPEI